MNCVRNALREPLCPAPSLKVTVAWVALLKASMCTVPGPAPLGGTTGGGTIAVAKALEKLSASPRPASTNDFMAHPPRSVAVPGKGRNVNRLYTRSTEGPHGPGTHQVCHRRTSKCSRVDAPGS